jgi:hypothetical protein
VAGVSLCPTTQYIHIDQFVESFAEFEFRTINQQHLTLGLTASVFAGWKAFYHAEIRKNLSWKLNFDFNIISDARKRFGFQREVRKSSQDSEADPMHV